MKYRIICNIVFVVLLGYRIYLILNSGEYESFYSKIPDTLIEMIFWFLFGWLPFIVIAVGFAANFFKHPIDVTINSLCIGLSILSFFCEGFLFVTGEAGGVGDDWVAPSINIYTAIISVTSIIGSNHEYKKKNQK